MTFSVECHTLFDITQSGISNRQRPNTNENIALWTSMRNTQCNFDTVVQAISLRSQPENITVPEKSLINMSETQMFGFLYEAEDLVPVWSFKFSVQHASVFYDGKHELGALYYDCDGIPMIKCGTEWSKLLSFLDTTEEMRNIYFKVIKDEDN
jgi:hypothetical protein